MAACARREIVRHGKSGIYHCASRCVRRAYLMGKDPLTGKDTSYRRDWVLERLALLVSSFAIDVGFFAVLSNHLHLVLRTHPRRVQRMGREEVARRWLRVFPGKRVLDGNWVEPTDEQVQALAADAKKIEEIRKRLCDVSWFMAALCEYIARRANLEEGVSGRYWQGRFSCREITSEAGLLVVGIYVDLNEWRAGLAATLEESLHSSLGCRLKGVQEVTDWLAPLTLAADDLGDVPSATGGRASDKGLLSMSLEDYHRLAVLVSKAERVPVSGACAEGVGRRVRVSGG
jgi:hypothetical protein